MSVPSLFGIDKQQWELINSFANWFSAAGAFSAAVVALYLANRAGKPSARVTVGHRILIGEGSKKPYPELIMFKIVNTGDRPIHINQIGWKTGLLKKRFAVQMHDATQSSPLPVELSLGQEASWMVPLNASELWLEIFSRSLLVPHYRVALWTLQGQFFTSIGHIFKVRPEENLLSQLRVACKKVLAGK